MSGSMTVHVRINDSSTGLPTPCRLRIAGPTGQHFAPFGRVADFPLGRNEDVGGHLAIGRKRFSYIDGSCEIRLPTGVPVEVEIFKGLEFEPIRETVTLGAGQMALRLSLRRWSNQRSEGWTAADTRCHFLSPHSALLEAAAEDVALVHLLAAEQLVPSQDGQLYRSIANMPAFSGQRPALEADGRTVIVNTFNTHPALGHLSLLHCHRPVFPLSFGGHNESDDWSLSDWCNQCHRKKGLVVWSDAFRSEWGLLGGEALVAAILGNVDALEIDAHERTEPFLPSWYRLLDAGISMPLVGSSGKDSNRIPIGAMRTCTLMPGETHYLAEWVAQIREGRTFVTNGPLIDLCVNGRPIGSRIVIENPQQKLMIRASARSHVPFDRLEVVANGEVIADAVPNASPQLAKIETELSLANGGWIAVRCHGFAKSDPYPLLPVFAHSSPIYIQHEGQSLRTVRNAIIAMKVAVDATRKWVESHARFVHEKSKIHLLDLCEDAQRVLNDRISSAR